VVINARGSHALTCCPSCKDSSDKTRPLTHRRPCFERSQSRCRGYVRYAPELGPDAAAQSGQYSRRGVLHRFVSPISCFPSTGVGAYQLLGREHHSQAFLYAGAVRVLPRHIATRHTSRATGCALRWALNGAEHYGGSKSILVRVLRRYAKHH
jgi:hypothetical protein